MSELVENKVVGAVYGVGRQAGEVYPGSQFGVVAERVGDSGCGYAFGLGYRSP